MTNFAFTSVPTILLPYIGGLVVAHAQMDAAIVEAIGLVAELDRATVVAFTSEIASTFSRAEILKHMARVKTQDKVRRSKVLVLADVAQGLCSPRNKVAHLLPYAYHPVTGSVTYFDPSVTVFPQIKIKKPTTLLPRDFEDLTNKMLQVALWLLLLRRQTLPDGVDPSSLSFEDVQSKLTHHPKFDVDSEFPWPEKLQKELRKARN